MRKLSFFGGFFFGVVGWGLASGGAAIPSWGDDRIPHCLSNLKPGLALPVMNDEVLEWKKTTHNNFKMRARIKGVMVKMTLSRPTHQQMEVKIGPNPGESIEVIYNREFGDFDAPKPGTEIEACGDYITAHAGERGGGPPSPMGAILHWVHFNPGNRDGGKHEHGYVTLGEQLFGRWDPLKRQEILLPDVPFYDANLPSAGFDAN